jgi:hypothetical protein
LIVINVSLPAVGLIAQVVIPWADGHNFLTVTSVRSGGWHLKRRSIFRVTGTICVSCPKAVGFESSVFGVLDIALFPGELP